LNETVNYLLAKWNTQKECWGFSKSQTTPLGASTIRSASRAIFIYLIYRKFGEWTDFNPRRPTLRLSLPPGYYRAKSG